VVPCEHLSGYWIWEPAGTFRCYGCGFQFCLADLPTREREIEKWEGEL
jgi:hypothetical protein